MKPRKYVIRVTNIESGESNFLSQFSLSYVAAFAQFGVYRDLSRAYRFSDKRLANALCRRIRCVYRDFEFEVIDITKEETE